MGLTIHYDLTLKDKAATAEAARNAVEKMRQLAFDLPFDAVGDVRHVAGAGCNPERRRGLDGELSAGAIKAGGHVQCPWNERFSRSVNATAATFFKVAVGGGCEPLVLGLATLPATIDWEYKEEDDQRFESEYKTGFPQWRFDFAKWKRKIKDRTPYRHWSETEIRQVPVKPSGWAWGSFCKTQYASDPQYGGVPNFLRCHIAAVTLLEKAGKLPGVKCVIQDEGSYGPDLKCLDWAEADAAGRKRKYVRGPGSHSPKALAEEVGEWNTMVAAMFGGLADALGGTGVTVDAPIQAFQNFEQLEFKGRKANDVGPFLQALAQMGEKP